MSPRREKLTSPQTRIALARGNRPVQHLLPVPEPVDTEAARRLFRAQRRTALRTVLLLSVVLFGLSGSFALFPALGQIRLAEVPVSWLLLTVAVYPALFGLALWHVRAAERLEDLAESRAGSRADDRAGDLAEDRDGVRDEGPDRERTGPEGSGDGPGGTP